MSTFIHPQAICEATAVGTDTQIWAFAHVLPGVVIGAECNIGDGVFVEDDVTIGDRVTVKSGAQVSHGVTLENDVFVGPNATFTNGDFPRGDQFPALTLVRRGASIGANATILSGLTIGAGATVEAGSVVTRDVPENAIVAGNPAHITGYANTVPHPTSASTDSELADGQEDITSGVKNVRLHRLTKAVDLRGSLVAGEAPDGIPFRPQRFFVVYDVPSAETRGSHAHKECEQYLICLKGSVSAIVDDGTHREEFRLDRPDIALYMPAMIWGTQYRYSPDAVLLVLASQAYDGSDYVRDYTEFLMLSRS